MRRLLVVLAAAVPALVAGVPTAGATDECRGLQVCVPVAGPWVVVPTARELPRTTVRFQLSCPEGHVVGGLDAELTDRAIDVGFAARLGSPVNPGVSTERAALFSATYVGATARAASFRPAPRLHPERRRRPDPDGAERGLQAGRADRAPRRDGARAGR